MDRYLVISSDGHAGLPPEEYRKYLESKYHDEYDRVVLEEIQRREEHEKAWLIRVTINCSKNLLQSGFLKNTSELKEDIIYD